MGSNGFLCNRINNVFINTVLLESKLVFVFFFFVFFYITRFFRNLRKRLFGVLRYRQTKYIKNTHQKSNKQGDINVIVDIIKTGGKCAKPKRFMEINLLVIVPANIPSFPQCVPCRWVFDPSY